MESVSLPQSHLYEFTRWNIPGSVDQPCYTSFYEGTVSTILKRCDASYAPIEEWDLSTIIPHPVAPEEEKALFANDNYIKIIKVTRTPHTAEELKKLRHVVQLARHLNIRLILPKTWYPPSIRLNIDNELFDQE